MSANRKQKKEKQGGRRRMSIGRACRLTMRGSRMLWKETPGYTALMYVTPVLRKIADYWGIFFTARLLDEILGARTLQGLVGYAGLLLLGGHLLRYIITLLESVISQKGFIFCQQTRMIFAKKVMEMDYSSLEAEDTHMLYKRVERETYNDGKNLQLLRYTMPQIVGELVSVGLSVALVWEFLRTMSSSGIWLIVFAALVLGGMWVSSLCNAAVNRYWIKCNNKISEDCLQRDGYVQYFEQYERGKEIRIFRLGRMMIQKLMESYRVIDAALDERLAKVLPAQWIGRITQESVNVVVWCVTATAALQGRITLGGMTQYTSSLNRMVTSITALWGYGIELWYNAEYLERYFEFMDTPCRMRSGCIPVEKRADMEYTVVFDHVSFRYPGSESYALRDVSIKFKAGEKMAVVGMNGSGKTTFIKLLCRLYDPTEGTIYLNGIDIRRYQYDEYLSLFSVVFQDFKLFSFGLGENIAVDREYEEEAVLKAAQKAGLSEFVEKQKHGLSAVLYKDFDKEGLEVSGGEAQKIALARAVCKGAPFVLLDEPTAALDPLAEYEIYSRFNDLVADRTTVFISHRMSSCRFCGDIAVFHEGRLIQRGSHEQLMQETGGKYYELWTAQAQYYRKDAAIGG
ncbi:MAG: ABC transporter ATP-binding protein [Lachnospiraceae bacterium]|nr:ABC transporter ATP-binding protein [Lachnospiraceae bacterium]